ncbi:hypothetical protein PHISCL_03170 [Aspergillus sclerotialis]|uniref:Chitin synthesis regulation, resistance to congo red-domain-containing protein n=1 Tax=Aspergillus sclerotialis TaxID=2070753 RepID=A0A3A2ZML1_9EURO|nr:hypothetical protein PHISCL_03170 [Aspergillus sclerotialis]
MAVLPREDCRYHDIYGNCRSSRWDDWGRWVVFAVIVGCALIVFFLFACFNARRRRNRGLRPVPGTAWMAPPPYPPPPQPYYADPQYQQHHAPPQYTPSPQAYGYFGGQTTGIELQQPPNSYQQAGDRVYPPPPVPPPAKG